MESKRYRKLIIAILMLVMLAIAVTSSINDAPTSDEPTYIASGLHYLKGGDFDFNLEQPPLVKEIIAFPLLFIPVNLGHPPKAHFEGFFQAQNVYAKQFFYTPGNDPNKLLQVSRIPVYLMLMALGLLIYLFTKRLFDYRAGLIALFLYAFTPFFLGIGKLSTTDLGATLFTFAALYAFYVFLEQNTPRRFLLTVILLAAALLSRFNTIVIIPLMLALAVVRPLSKDEWHRGTYLKRLAPVLTKTILLVMAGVILVLTFYGIHTSHLSREAQLDNLTNNLEEGSPYLPVLEKINGVSPPLSHYLLGVFHSIEHNQANRQTYWDGSLTKEWRWYFFPFIFLVKTPLPTLLLFLVGLLLALRKIRIWDNAFVLISLLVLGLSCETVLIQTGARYMMPVIPFSLVLAGRGGAGLLDHIRNKRLGRTALGIILFASALSVLSFYPSFISYSNELIVNKQEAHRWLTDDNLDWGQDLSRLADYVEERGISNLKLDYFGGGYPPYYIPDVIYWSPEMGMPHGWLAVSYSLFPTLDQEWISGYKPEADIGGSIVLYYIP